jgi:hypothetical protein
VSRADYRFFIAFDIVATPRPCYVGAMNEHQRRAIVYGDSLILEGVRASLVKCPGLEVLVLHQLPEKLPDELRAYGPAALIFDMGAIQPELLLSLFQQPGLLLIGIDPETHQALVWSGRQAAAVDAADLLLVIFGQGRLPRVRLTECTPNRLSACFQRRWPCRVRRHGP